MNYFNKNTNVTLTEAEYTALVKREAREAYAAYLEELEENETAMTFEKMLNSCFESETDFVAVDEDGNLISAFEYEESTMM